LHLSEILKHRAVSLDGVYLALTKQCPLVCEHCSTNSHPLATSSPDEESLLKFVKSFQYFPPKIIFLTGGEPFLLPSLIRSICKESHRFGSHVVCITGLFFAKGEDIPSDIFDSIKYLDHLMVSIDIFHEKQLGRANIFKVLHKIRNEGIDISIAALGYGGDDPYLKDLIKYVRVQFNDEVPIFVNSINPIGRAQDLNYPEYYGSIMATADHRSYSNIEGCKMASWPTVAFDGIIVNCCNEFVIDGPRPSHLVLGNIKNTDWSSVRKKVLHDTIIKAIRLVGPKETAKRSDSDLCEGYCSTCISLENVKDLEDKIRPWVQTPGMNFLDEYLKRYYYDNVKFSTDIFSELIYLGTK